MEIKTVMREIGKGVTYTVLTMAFAIQTAIGVEVGYTDGDLAGHLFFAFFHANVFHLAGNLLATYLLYHSASDLVVGYIISVAASFVAVSTTPTLGFSGIIYAIIGMRTSLLSGRITFGKAYFIAFMLSGLVLPNVNGLLHILCFSSGLLVRHIRKIRHDYAKASR